MNESRTTLQSVDKSGNCGASTRSIKESSSQRSQMAMQAKSRKVVLPSSNNRQYIFMKDKRHFLGEGSFAKVYRGVMVRQEQVAIKHIRMNRLEKHEANLKEEIRIMKDLHHKNIVNLLDVVETHGQMYLVMEHCEDGDLKKYINNKPMREKSLKLYMIQLMEGLQYLHDKNIMHRDLKPHNLLLTNNKKTLKISDFGFAKSMSSEESMAQTMCGTPYYMAPEIMQNKQYLSKADLWSVGIIMYEMAYGKYPYSNVYGPFDLRDKIETIDIEYPTYPDQTSNDLSDDAVDLMNGLLQKDPAMRVSWEEFFTHPWLNPNVITVSRGSRPHPPTSRPIVVRSSPQMIHSQSAPPSGASNMSKGFPPDTSIFNLESVTEVGGFTPTDINSINFNSTSPFLSEVKPKPFLNLVSNYRSSSGSELQITSSRLPVQRSEPALVKRHPQYEEDEEYTNANQSSTMGTLKGYASTSYKLMRDSLKSFQSLP